MPLYQLFAWHILTFPAHVCIKYPSIITVRASARERMAGGRALKNFINFERTNISKMEQQLQQIRDQQRAAWNKFSPGWKKWDNLIMGFLKPMGDSMAAQLKLHPADRVLDIAAGTGEPGLSLAPLVPMGKVVITDLAEDMLTVAQENAASRAIANVEFRACDVSELPFEDNSFDAISCRLGFMFFPDMQLAAREMFRVLKPGGRLAASVWNIPDKNFWLTVMGETISRNMQLPPPPPDAPGVFRCAQSGLIAGIFKNAGLKNITEKEIPLKLNTGTADVYWSMQTEIAAPVVAALSKADDSMRAKIKAEVFEKLKQKFAGRIMEFEASSLVISAEK